MLEIHRTKLKLNKSEPSTCRSYARASSAEPQCLFTSIKQPRQPGAVRTVLLVLYKILPYLISLSRLLRTSSPWIDRVRQGLWFLCINLCSCLVVSSVRRTHTARTEAVFCHRHRQHTKSHGRALYNSGLGTRRRLHQ